MASLPSKSASSAQASSSSSRNGNSPRREHAFRIADVDAAGDGRRGRTSGRSPVRRGNSPHRVAINELLAPFKGIKKPPRSPSPRPSVGQLRPRSMSSPKITDLALLLPKEEAEEVPDYTPESPLRFAITGTRLPGGGYGKVLVPPLNRDELGLADSSQSSPPRRNPRVRRHRQPPPITGLPGEMEYSDEENGGKEEEKPPTVESLQAELKVALQRINHLDEKVAEAELARMETGDKIELLRKALCAKLKRLFRVTGNENLYGPE